MTKVKDVLEDVKFNEFLGYEIEAYNNRPAPGEGLKYKRTPFDNIKEAGLFNVEGIRAKFIEMAEGKGNLPRSQRDAITGLVFKVCQLVVNFREKEEAAKKTKKKRVKKQVTEINNK
jgi:hypothetical protein